MSGIGPRCAGRPQCRCPCHAEATRPCTTTTALIGSYSLIHSFNNYAMGTVARPFHRVPAPIPEHPQRPGAALRLPHPSEAAARTLPRRARVTRIPVPASTAHERPRPTPSQPRVPRPPPHFAASDPPGSWGEGGARPSRPPARGSGIVGARDAGTSGPGLAGRAHLPLTSAGSEPSGLL